MKQGKSLSELAIEIERQREVKHDYIANSAALVMAPDAKRIQLAGAGDFGITANARSQLATKLGIPMAYFDRLQEKHPELLAHNVNELARREPERYMVRTLDGNMRALMSEKFRPLDNYDFADAILPIIQEAGVKVASCEITERNLFIKVLMPWLDRELPVPANLKMGVGHHFFPRKIVGALTFRNSEVGAGALSISPGTFEMQCTNYATYRDEGFGKMHIGRKANDDGESVSKYLSDETRRLDDATVWAKVRDVTRAAMDGRVMDAIVERLVAARNDVIDGDPAKLVEVFGKKNALTQDERGGLLKHLAGAGEMTRYGLQWAVTRLSQDVESYDRASDLERLGGQVIELPKNDWQELLKAA